MTSSKKIISRHAAGFSLVELLVVVGIIAVLIGMLLPVLAKARQQSRMIVEMAASRQLVTSYLSYASDYNGWLIPGNLASGPLGLTDDMGVVLNTTAAERWPWRIQQYSQYGIGATFLVNDQADNLANRSMPSWSYLVSLNPSFGLNYYDLGGGLDNTANDAIGCVMKITAVSDASRMIVFVSARGPATSPNVPGYFRVEPPTYPHFTASGWTTADYIPTGDIRFTNGDPNAFPVAWGFVDARWNNRAIVAHLDGHSELLSISDLRDMTRWAEPAAESADPNWKAH